MRALCSVATAGAPLSLALLRSVAKRARTAQAPAYYWRDGTGNGTKSAILFLEGGGW